MRLSITPRSRALTARRTWAFSAMVLRVGFWTFSRGGGFSFSGFPSPLFRFAFDSSRLRAAMASKCYNRKMNRCREKASYELLRNGSCIESKRARSYRCGHKHFGGEIFLCFLHTHAPGHKW